MCQVTKGEETSGIAQTEPQTEPRDWLDKGEAGLGRSWASCQRSQEEMLKTALRMHAQSSKNRVFGKPLSSSKRSEQNIEAEACPPELRFVSIPASSCIASAGAGAAATGASAAVVAAAAAAAPAGAVAV
eukprot:397338-Pleurochrysis_carterae.AAC.6